MLTIILLSLGVILLGVLFYKWATDQDDFFEKRGVPFIAPKFLFGSIRSVMFKRETLMDGYSKMYNAYPDSKIVGFFEFKRPIYMIRDPELIKRMAIKDLDSFLDHRLSVDELSHTLMGRGLFALGGSKWKDMRATLSPAFTGNKMRQMFQLILEVSERTTKCLLEKSKTEAPLVLEMRELFTKYSNDAIASCGFGAEINTVENPKNEFYKIVEGMTGFSVDKIVILFAFLTCPKLFKLFEMEIFSKKVQKYFRSMVMNTMKYREENNIIRHDMLHMIMQHRKGKLVHEQEKLQDHDFSVVQESEVGLKPNKREWEDDDLLAQLFLFFFAGFHTISTVMSFAAYELAVNKDVQDKLIDEIDQVRNQLNGELLTYDIVSKMKYMDMVISESLRIWTPNIFTDRKCTKPYDIELDNKTVRIEPGELVIFPITLIQMDPKYYENPDKFIPERFSDENKHKINRDTYMPFGVGPRNCIGSRFAVMECKTLLFNLLTSFTFEVCEKTQVPLKLGKSGFVLLAEKGIWVQLKPRN